MKKEEIEKIKEICVEKIIENIEKTKAFIASPSNSNPNYVYHWTRDAALTIRVIIDKYLKTQESKYFQILIKYVACEYELQQLFTEGGLGEPKFNVDRTAFTSEWGRPQNDGSALRGLAMLKILPLLTDEYSTIAKKLVIPIIKNDVNYLLKVIEHHCFDLWEEKDAYHFYTRVVQAKFIKDCFLYFYKNPSSCFDDDYLITLKSTFERLKELINHHYDQCSVISSFDCQGNEFRRDDAAVILAVCHTEFDRNIINPDKYHLIDKNLSNLLYYFIDKYKNNKHNFIGRYMDDRYFDGHTWILCTLGMVQYLLYRDDDYSYSENNHLLNPENIVKSILAIDNNLDLAEQYDPSRNLQISAKKLTWNYSEFYFALQLFKT